MDHFSRNKKEETIKVTPFCSEECAESIGTVRWTLATSNVEIIDPIYIFQNGRFLPKKVIFLENDWSDRSQQQRKLPRPSPQREEKQCKVETFWCVLNILKESNLENFTSLYYRSE